MRQPNAKRCTGVHFVQNGAMLRIAQHKWTLRLGMVLFLAGQALSVAHASEFGHEPHEHNGVACVAILTDEPDGLVPAASLSAPKLTALAFVAAQPGRQARLGRPHAVRPPPTGPPSV